MEIGHLREGGFYFSTQQKVYFYVQAINKGSNSIVSMWYSLDSLDDYSRGISYNAGWWGHAKKVTPEIFHDSYLGKNPLPPEIFCQQYSLPLIF